MPTPYPFGVIVRVLRTGSSPGRDSRGQPLPGPDESFDVPGCVVAPRQESPQPGGPEQQGRDTVLVGVTVYAPPSTDIRTTDQIQITEGHRYQDVVFQVTGEPGDWGRNPFTGTRGPVQFAADRITG